MAFVHILNGPLFSNEHKKCISTLRTYWRGIYGETNRICCWGQHRLVCKLRQYLYGLKSSHRAWFVHFYLLSNNVEWSEYKLITIYSIGINNLGNIHFLLFILKILLSYIMIMKVLLISKNTYHVIFHTKDLGKLK